MQTSTTKTIIELIKIVLLGLILWFILKPAKMINDDSKVKELIDSVTIQSRRADSILKAHGELVKDFTSKNEKLEEALTKLTSELKLQLKKLDDEKTKLWFASDDENYEFFINYIQQYADSTGTGLNSTSTIDTSRN